MSAYEFYKVEKKGPVAWVYLNRPEKNNAMHLPAWTEAVPVFESIDADPEIRAVIIAGKGNCFCAGLDLLEMASAVPELAEPNPQGGAKWRLVRKIRELQETMNVIERCRKPVIAAIHGHCIGAGLDMAAAQALAETIAANAPLAVQAAKDVLNYSAGRPVDDGLRYVAGISANIIPSADLMEAVSAFAEKRKPKFTGE